MQISKEHLRCIKDWMNTKTHISLERTSLIFHI